MLTFHDVDEGPDVSLLDDDGAGLVLHGVHAVHDLADLAHVQVLHEVVVQDGLSYQLFGTAHTERRTRLYNTSNNAI